VEARLLRIWLPPRFNPNSESASAKLFAQRLSDFEASHPGLKIDIRIKAEEGTTSLLNALTITRNAAPSTLPDLIALPRRDLESAAQNGLLHPIDGLSTLLHDPNWYPYARELGHIQNIGYGLPFAGDALVFIHRPDLDVNTWDAIFAGEEPMLFAAGDPQALIFLSLYVSAGGKLTDDQNQPTLEEEPLTQILTLIKSGLEANVFFQGLLNYETDTDSYQAYRDGRGSMAITWSTNRPSEIHPIPIVNSAHTFANAWVWALAGSSVENQQLAVDLAEYLLADPYSGDWLEATGYLPTRLSQGSDRSYAQILDAAQAIPDQEVLAVLGPVLNQALIRLFEGEQVEVIVRSVLEQVQ
jgi:ABC-type glycerol-3-phosphate transport system substrate-binding protein